MPSVQVALWTPTAVAASVTLGVAGHVAGRESAPDLLGILLAVTVCGLVWSTAGVRRPTRAGVTCRVWLSQALVHGALVVGAGTTTGAAPGNGAHAHHGGAASAPIGWHGGWSMLVAHLVAGALLAWWLHRGESLARDVARRILARLTEVLPPTALPVAGLRRRLPGGTRPRIVAARLAIASTGRRGPPRPRC